MTIRNLHFMFNPASIVWVSQNQKPDAIESVLARNLGNAGFKGELFYVNKNNQNFQRPYEFPDVESLPKPPELAVINLSLNAIPSLIEKLGRLGTRSVVVISNGLSDNGCECENRMRDEMLHAARPYLLRILGPDSMGIIVPGAGLNASIGHIQPIQGNIAFISQSASVQATVLDWAASNGIGFSHFVSMGDMADVDVGDMLDYLSTDYSAKAILLYIESITNPRKFMSAARAAARMKPVIVVKSGRYTESARVFSSDGTRVGTDDVCNAAFQRAGILRVMDIQALFDAVETLTLSQRFSGEHLAILTNGGGMGALAIDALIDKKGCPAKLSPETIARLNNVLPQSRSLNSLVNIFGDAPPARYVDALTVLLEDDGVNALLIMYSSSAVTSGTEVARGVVETLKQSGTKTSFRGIFTCWPGKDSAREARKIFTENRIPTYETPTEAIRGFMQIVRYRRSQEMLMETPPNIPEIFEPETDQARRIIDGALSEGRTWLTETEVNAVLTAYEIPVGKKCEPDGEERSGESPVGHDGSGFQLKPKSLHPHSWELYVGVHEDVQFGPVILFGQGGEAVEIIQDKAIALPPLNMHLAREVMRRTRINRLLQGYEDQSAADMDAIALTLVKVSHLICDIADIVNLEINPLFANEQGVVAGRARIKVVESNLPDAQRLVIRPYPKELENTLTLPDGQRLLLRPIRPEDEPAFQELFSKLTQDEIRLRFLHAMRYLSHNMAARLTQIDYDREMALVLCDPAAHKEKTLYGMVRITADSDNERAEFDILIHHDMTGIGLGPMLLRRIIDCARKRGIREIFGEVLAENGPMLKLCNAFGFKKKSDPDDPGVMIVTLAL